MSRETAAIEQHQHENSTNAIPCESNLFEIRQSPKGRGLFAIKDILPNTLLHVAPCICVTQGEYKNHMKYTIFEHYLFNGAGGNKLLALGYGSLFNHSRQPNVDYRVDTISQKINYFTGHHGAQAGQELCITYGGNLWFDDADGTCESSDSASNQDECLPSFLGRMELGEET